MPAQQLTLRCNRLLWLAFMLAVAAGLAVMPAVDPLGRGLRALGLPAGAAWALQSAGALAGMLLSLRAQRWAPGLARGMLVAGVLVVAAAALWHALHLQQGGAGDARPLLLWWSAPLWWLVCGGQGAGLRPEGAASPVVQPAVGEAEAAPAA
ncbi:hypothetical protein [Ideonella livida]|uniref:Uncharacterized protein n=1 Tax=Ideonella livida TaxID=2707176 RepID=A0A7C9TMV8_9BURK|nr:hypothetical protein [Ideonella livida]NDY92687.1 hypothetical protein [Ideonella livida]